MFRLTVFACAAALVYGCCTPPQWNGDQSVMYASTTAGSQQAPILSRGVQMINADSNARMIAVDGNSTYNGQMSSFRVIMDYNKYMKYTAYGNTCTKEPISKMENPFCIPADATMVSRDVLGVGSNSLAVTTYNFQYDGQTVEMTITDDCVPVSETVTSEKNGTYTYMNIGMANIKTGLSSTTAFQLPAACMSDTDALSNIIFGR